MRSERVDVGFIEVGLALAGVGFLMADSTSAPLAEAGRAVFVLASAATYGFLLLNFFHVTWDFGRDLANSSISFSRLMLVACHSALAVAGGLVALYLTFEVGSLVLYRWFLMFMIAVTFFAILIVFFKWFDWWKSVK